MWVGCLLPASTLGVQTSVPLDVPISCYEDIILMRAEDKYAFISPGHGASPSIPQAW